MSQHPPGGPGRRIVVVGGGIAGLASAALLARDGHTVTVLEKQPATGGRVGTWASGGFRFDTGPSWYLMPEVFDHFFRLMGTSAAEQLDLRVLDPGYRVYFEGDPDPVDVRQARQLNLDLFESIEPGAGRRLGRYLDSARLTYTLAKKYFLYSSFASFRPLLNREVLRHAGKLVRLLLEPLDRFAGRYFRDHRLRQILGYPAVFLGSAPSLTPSMYHLMSHLDLEDGVLYPQGGFGRIVEAVEALAVGHGVRIIRNAEVTQILTGTGPVPAQAGAARAGLAARLSAGSGRARGGKPRTTRGGKPRTTGVSYRTAGGTARTEPADVVVSAADLHHTETQLLPAGLRTYPERYWKRRIAGPGALLLMLGVEGPLPRLEHHTLLFTRNWKENFGAIFGKDKKVPDPASLYVCRPGATDPGTAPASCETLFVLVPVPADPGLGSGGIDGAGAPALEALADTVIDQLAEWTGTGDLAARVRVRRIVGPGDFAADFNSWQGTALGPAHVLKQSAFLRGSNKSRKVEGLYYAGGTTIPGIGLPMCLISAEILLKRLRGDTSTTALPEPAAAETVAVTAPETVAASSHAGGSPQAGPADLSR